MRRLGFLRSPQDRMEVVDAISRRIDSTQYVTLMVNALDMAIRNRRPEPGSIVYAGNGTQHTS